MYFFIDEGTNQISMKIIEDTIDERSVTRNSFDVIRKTNNF
jgi:hypothetical protein